MIYHLFRIPDFCARSSSITKLNISLHPELLGNVLVRRRMSFPGVSNDRMLSSLSPFR